MTRRKTIGTVVAVALGLAGSVGATAWAYHGGGGRPAFMKRMAAHMLDDALDAASVTPEQRTAIHAARDRVFAALEVAHQDREARREAALQIWQADRVDEARVEALRAQVQAEHQRVGDALVQALREVHDVLTPAQRTALADHVRAHRPHRWQ